MYIEFHRFGQAKIRIGGSTLSLSQFLLLPQLPQKTALASKVVKNDSKKVISLRLAKSVTHSVVSRVSSLKTQDNAENAFINRECKRALILTSSFKLFINSSFLVAIHSQFVSLVQNISKKYVLIAISFRSKSLPYLIKK